MKLPISLAVLACATTACMTIRPVAAPADFVTTRNPEFVWVQHHDGEMMPVGKLSLLGDTLVGTRLDTSEPVRTTLPRIRMMSARQLDRTRTALLVATATGLAGFIVYRATRSSGPKANCYFDGHEWTCI